MKPESEKIFVSPTKQVESETYTNFERKVVDFGTVEKWNIEKNVFF